MDVEEMTDAYVGPDEIKQALREGHFSDDFWLDLMQIARHNNGIAMVAVTRADAESQWQETTATDDDLPDELWERIRSAWSWKHFPSDTAMDLVWFSVNDAIGDAIKSLADEPERK